MFRPLRKKSSASKLFEKIVDDLDKIIRSAHHKSWSIVYDEEEFFAREQMKVAEKRRALLRRLQKQQLIAVHKTGHAITVVLRDHGRHERLRILMNERPKLPRDVYCLVSFDIPEDTRKIRLALRTLLKSGRFKQLHKSVWISPYDCADLLDDFVRETKSKKWIQIFTAKTKIH